MSFLYQSYCIDTLVSPVIFHCDIVNKNEIAACLNNYLDPHNSQVNLALQLHKSTIVVDNEPWSKNISADTGK